MLIARYTPLNNYCALADTRRDIFDRQKRVSCKEKIPTHALENDLVTGNLLSVVKTIYGVEVGFKGNATLYDIQMAFSTCI